MTTEPVILLGGSGFLGGALAGRLAAAGVPAIAAGRSNDAEALRVALGGKAAAAVIDLACPAFPGSPAAEAEAIPALAERHAALAGAVGARRFLFVSSGGAVYGEGDGQPLDEERAPRPISAYGKAKLAAEAIIRAARPDAIILRPSNVYGPGQAPFRGQGLVATAFGAALAGRPLEVAGDGSTVRDYLYVDDFTDGALAALERGETGATYNLGSGEGTNVRALLGLIGDVVAADGLSLDIFEQPVRPVDVACNILDAGRLSAATGWRPRVPLTVGLRASWQWVKGR